MQQKEINWREFVSKEGNSDPWGAVYKICREKKERNVISAVKVDGRMTIGWNETMSALLNEFFLESTRQIGGGYDRNMNDVEDRKFEWDEIGDAVKRMRSGRVPGLDGVTAEMIKKVWIAVPCANEKYV